MGRNVSAVKTCADSKGAFASFTQTFIVPLYVFKNDIYFPSGESWPPAITGGPKNSSRSISGGKLFVWACVGAVNARTATSKMVLVNRIIKVFSEQRSLKGI